MEFNSRSEAVYVVGVWVVEARKLPGQPIHVQRNTVSRLLSRGMANTKPSIILDEIGVLLGKFGVKLEEVGTSWVELDLIRRRIEVEYNRCEVVRKMEDSSYFGIIALKEMIVELGFKFEDFRLTNAEIDRKIAEARIADSRAMLEEARRAERPCIYAHTLHCDPAEIGSSQFELTALRKLGEARWWVKSSFQDERIKAELLGWEILELLSQALIEPEQIGSSYAELEKFIA